MNYNKAILSGNLTGNPEIKKTPAGTAVATFSIATNRNYTQDGQKKEEVQFHNIVFFGKQAENIGKYLIKGSNVLLEGRIENRSWEHEGKKYFRTEIIGENIQFGSKPQKEEQVEEDDIKTEDIPF